MCKDGECVGGLPDMDGGMLKECERFRIFLDWGIATREIETSSS